MNRTPIRILIVDDHEVILSGLRQFLSVQQGRYSVLDTARNAREAIERNQAARP